jgi:hypothetical protein
MRKIIISIICLLSFTDALAAPEWWQQLYPSNSNNQVTLKDENNNNLTAITNPTAASVQANVNTSTQPPTVIVQATATLPVVAIGSACVYGTNTAALSSADRITLLTCPPSNTWQITNRVALQTAVAGNACNITTDGNIAVDATGLTLSCQSGVWKKQGSTFVAANIAIPIPGNVNLAAYVPVSATAVQVSVYAGVFGGASWAWITVDGNYACINSSQYGGADGPCASAITLTNTTHSFNATGSTYVATITGYWN